MAQTLESTERRARQPVMNEELFEQTPKRGFTGYWIPVEVADDPNLRLADKFLLALIHALSQNEHKACYASNAHLAKRLGMTTGSVVNALTRLRKLDYIVDIAFDGRYRLLRASIKQWPQHPSNDVGRLHQRMDIDKRKDKRTNKYSLPSELQSLELDWADWLQHRREIRKAMTPKTFQKQLKQLQEWGVEKSKAAIEQSIANGWTGLFAPRAERAPLPEQLTRLSDAELRKRREAIIAAKNEIFQTYGKNPQGAVGEKKRKLWKERLAIEAEQDRRNKARRAA
jgi:hypothetical protein